MNPAEALQLRAEPHNRDLAGSISAPWEYKPKRRAAPGGPDAAANEQTRKNKRRPVNLFHGSAIVPHRYYQRQHFNGLGSERHQEDLRHGACNNRMADALREEVSGRQIFAMQMPNKEFRPRLAVGKEHSRNC